MTASVAHQAAIGGGYPMTHDTTSLETLKKSCTIDPETGCWLWLGAKLRSGYGCVWDPKTRKTRRTHQLAFELGGGIVPDGNELHHECNMRACCNPDHIKPITHAENLRLGSGFSATNAKVTHCPFGHPYTESNTRRYNKKGRDCRMCHNIRHREYKKAARLAAQNV